MEKHCFWQILWSIQPYLWSIQITSSTITQMSSHWESAHQLSMETPSPPRGALVSQPTWAPSVHFFIHCFHSWPSGPQNVEPHDPRRMTFHRSKSSQQIWKGLQKISFYSNMLPNVSCTDFFLCVLKSTMSPPIDLRKIRKRYCRRSETQVNKQAGNNGGLVLVKLCAEYSQCLKNF